MTTYTADDFKRAEFARHQDGRIAERIKAARHPSSPWVDMNGYVTDEGMVLEGWVPVQEQAGSYTRTDEDSGVAAEALTGSTLAAHFRDKRDMERARAEKAEQERDDAIHEREAAIRRERDHRNNARCWMKTSEKWQGTAEEWEARAEKAEQALAEMTAHRDKSRDTAIKWQMEANRVRGERDEATAELFATQPRPLTPDAITDEARVRARAELTKFIFDGGQVESSEGARARAVDIILTAALTEHPERPEGAEEIEALVDAWKLAPECPSAPRPTLPDYLAERGVRVTGAES